MEGKDNRNRTKQDVTQIFQNKTGTKNLVKHMYNIIFSINMHSIFPFVCEIW